MSDRAHCPALLDLVPFRPGVVLVTFDAAESGFHARHLLEAHAAQGKSSLSLPFPPAAPVISLQTGTSRSFAQMRSFRGLCPQLAAANVEHRHAGREDFDFLREEGFQVLLDAVSTPSAGWVSLEQSFGEPLPQHVIEGFTRARHEALGASKHIMLFSSAPSPVLRQQIARFVDEVVEIDTCEPDPNARHSFSVRWSGARFVGDLGTGAVMVSVRLQNDRYRYRGAAYVSKDLAGRVMWRLRCADWTLQTIADLFRLNRSSVKRRLDQMPPVRPMRLPAGWLERYRDYLDISTEGEI
jgi:hypothetical protein